MQNNEEEEAFFNEYQRQKDNKQAQKAEVLRSMPESQRECNKCHKKTVNPQGLAIRRHDEPEVTNYICLCGHKWKER